MTTTRAAIWISACLTAIFFMPLQSATAQTVTLDFAPDVGASWKVIQTWTQTKSNDGGVPKTSATTATLRVVGVMDQGYLMEWTTDSVTVNNVVVRNQPEMLIGTPIRFEADEGGFPVRVHDAKKIIDAALAMIGIEGDPIVDKTREFMTSMEPEGLAALVLKDAATIAHCHNFEVEMGVDINAEEYMPNALGGPAIKSLYTVTLEDAGSTAIPARIRIKQAYDPESAAVSMYETIKNLSGKAVADKNLQDGKLPKLKMQSNTVCHVDRTSGAAVRVVHERENGVGEELSRDVRILLLEPL